VGNLWVTTVHFCVRNFLGALSEYRVLFWGFSCPRNVDHFCLLYFTHFPASLDNLLSPSWEPNSFHLLNKLLAFDWTWSHTNPAHTLPLHFRSTLVLSSQLHLYLPSCFFSYRFSRSGHEDHLLGLAYAELKIRGVSLQGDLYTVPVLNWTLTSSGAFVKLFHLGLSTASPFASSQLIPLLRIYLSVVHFRVVLGLPLFLVPWELNTKPWRKFSSTHS
jgi:hypothetical protein